MRLSHATLCHHQTKALGVMRRTNDLRSETGTDTLQALLAEVAAAGVVLDAQQAGAWLEAVVRADATPDEFAIAVEEGIGGHELALIDFDPTDVEHLRRIGRLIRAPALLGVSSALAISGSTAQGRIHPFPADVDFFERVHIVAPDEAEARLRLAQLVRANATEIDALSLDEVIFGVAADRTRLRWTPDDVDAGRLTLRGTDAADGSVTWEDAAADPGFVKIDWLMNDPAGGGLGWVTKVIDATWQTPDGPILSLDERIDADYQQVYLDTADARLAARLTSSLREADRAWYISQLELEVHHHCLSRPPNYGKVARRLYNLCRLTGRYVEALYLRGLFAGAAARLYQAHPRLRLIVIQSRRDPSGAHVSLAALIDDLAGVLPPDPSLSDVVAACRAALLDPIAADFLAATSQLDLALAESASHAFALRLHAFRPVSDLLASLGVRREA
jgi:hypothetical protein